MLKDNTIKSLRSANGRVALANSSLAISAGPGMEVSRRLVTFLLTVGGPSINVPFPLNRILLMPIICDDGTIEIVKALLSDTLEKDCKALYYVRSLTEIVRP